MTICSCSKVHLIAPDGGLRHIHPSLAPDLEKLGWRQVLYPKRTYYPEYDKTSAAYREQEILNVNEDTDTLQVEKL